jgi:hypothetical protein
MSIETPPRCALCPRPARYQQHRDGTADYATYCRGGTCTNRERICKTCGELFQFNTGDAGTKYCSTVCKLHGYNPKSQEPGARRRHTCPWCGALSEWIRLSPTRTWPWVCESCLEPLDLVMGRLREHKVPIEMARRLLTDPTCELCRVNIVAPVRTRNRIQVLLAVDHDHACCPGGSSCGKCVRGLLCSTCNSALGLLGEDTGTLHRAAGYLDRWVSQR